MSTRLFRPLAAGAPTCITVTMLDGLVPALPIDEWSLKVSAGPPDDVPADLDRPVWAGTVALQHVWATPISAPDLRGDHPVPDYVGAWRGGRT